MAQSSLARSLWAFLRPLPGKPFPNRWDFCVEACVLQDRDRFVFGDFVVVIAALFDGLDECGELLLVDHGLFFHAGLGNATIFGCERYGSIIFVFIRRRFFALFYSDPEARKSQRYSNEEGKREYSDDGEYDDKNAYMGALS